MPKNKKRKKNSTAAAPQKGIRSMVPICVRAVLISYLVFMVCAALLAWFVLRKESAPTKTVQMAFLMAITAFSFLLCGFLSARKNRFSVIPICFFSGFALLILLISTLLLAAKGEVGVLICAPIGMGILCPILGGITAKRV